ncbi:MAG: type II secretion system F family protein [Planctomycetaceae bacterium]
MSDSKPLSLDELSKLNDEIITLSRAGVPVEAGLRAYAKSGNSAAEKAAGRIAARLEAGQSLPDSIKQDGGRFPVVYPTVLEAGVRSGHLPIALESISEFSRDLSELRRGLFHAVLYPLITVIAAYSLFVVFVSNAISRILNFAEVNPETVGVGTRLLMWLSDNLMLWWWIPPVLLLVAVALWMTSGRASVLSLGGSGWILRLLPGMSRAMRWYRHSMFARLAALLVEHNIPFHDVLPLAAGGCGPALKQAALAIAEADANGQRDAVDQSKLKGMQSLVRWILLRQQSAEQLAKNLKTVATSYHDRGQMTLRWIRFAAPLVFTIFVGGGLVAAYTVSLFLPLTDMMNQLAEEAL